MRHFYIPILLLVLSACESTQETTKTHTLTNADDIEIVSYPAEIRSAYIRKAKPADSLIEIPVLVKDTDGKPKLDANGNLQYELKKQLLIKGEYIVCAEPPPDTAVSSQFGFNTGVDLQLANTVAALSNVTNTIALSTAQSLSSQASNNSVTGDGSDS